MKWLYVNINRFKHDFCTSLDQYVIIKSLMTKWRSEITKDILESKEKRVSFYEEYFEWPVIYNQKSVFKNIYILFLNFYSLQKKWFGQGFIFNTPENSY